MIKMTSLTSDQRYFSVNVLMTFALTGFLFYGGYAQCTLPAALQNSVWIDSDKGELVFDTSNMTGWDLDYDTNPGAPFEKWECYHTENDDSKIYLVFKLSEILTILAEDYNVFMCMQLTKVTDYSYYYYLLWSDLPPTFKYDRISGQEVNTTIDDPRNQVCLNSNNPAHTAVFPHIGEYHILLKKGFETAASQECPSSFFGVYRYNITDLDTNTESCGDIYDILDVCSDYTKMSFNNSACNTKIAYTENGSLACIVNFASGDYIYHTAYNEDDTVDDVTTYRFTCFVSSLASDGSLQVSQTMRSCKKDQTPDSQPLHPNGSIAGLNIKFTPNRLCPKTSDDSESETGGLTTGALVGIIIGVILFIIAIIIIVFLCVKCRKPSGEKNENVKKQSPNISPREKAPIISIETTRHQTSSMWPSYSHGEPPNDTKFSGDNRVSKSPDEKFNPFSVPPFSNRHVTEEKDPTPTPNDETRIQNPVEATPIQETETNSTSKMPEGKESGQHIQLDPTPTPNAQSKLDETRIQNPVEATPIQESDTYSTSKISEQNEGKESSQHIQPYSLIKNDQNQSPSSLSGLGNKSLLKVTERETIVFSNDAGKQTYVQGIDGGRKMTMTPVDLHENQATIETKINPEIVPLSRTNVNDGQQSVNVDRITPNNYIQNGVVQVQETPKFKESKPYTKKHKKVSAKETGPFRNKTTKNGSIGIKTMSNKHKSKQHSKKRGDDAHRVIAGMQKAVSFRRSQNKRGTFYNENMIAETESRSYIPLPVLNETVYSDTGIYYDEDNEYERAMIKMNDTETNISEQDGNNDKMANKTLTDKLNISVDSVVSPSRISDITVMSSRMTNTPTSSIDSKAVQYFIDNETNSIAINVKSETIPEESSSGIDDEETFHEDSGDEYEDEGEKCEFGDKVNDINTLEEVNTAMTVLYGNDEEDPDRMILGNYGPDVTK